MFEVGFSELVLIMVIALLVLGPERLPKVARSIGLWVGKARSMARNVTAEIKREIAADELQRVLDKHAGSTDPFEIIEKITQPDKPAVAANHEQPASVNPADSTAHDRQP